MKQNIRVRFWLIMIATVLMGMVALPASMKSLFPDSGISQWLQERKLHLGLDLQGGTQLDYLIDLKQAKKYNEDDDPDNDVSLDQLVEGVRTTIERRVDGLGVSEPRIFISSIADEKHIIVELAGIKDIEEAKRIVGKTIQLEFKELKTELDPEEKGTIKKEAEEILSKLLSDKEDFELVGQKAKTADGKVEWNPSKKSFKDELSPPVQEKIWESAPGTLIEEVILTVDGYVVNNQGQLSPKEGFVLLKVLEKTETDREVTEPGESFEEVAKSLENTEEEVQTETFVQSSLPHESLKTLSANALSEVIESESEVIVYKIVTKTEKKESVQASHVLIAYEGADRSQVVRSKEEARKISRTVYDRALSGEDFSELAKTMSDGPSKEKGGDLGSFGRGAMTPAFEEVAFSLKEGEISQPVETPFGFHIIKKGVHTQPAETEYEIQKLSIPQSPTAKMEAEKALERMKEQKVQKKESQIHYQEIFFSTVPDEWKTTGLDGGHFKRAAVVFSDTGFPLISIDFDTEGGEMFAALTERNIEKPIGIFVGGDLISSPRVNEKISGGSAQITGQFTLKQAADLAMNLNTGAIPAPIDIVGQITIGATLGAEAFSLSIFAGLVGLGVLAVFLLFTYRLFGLIAVFALLIYSVILLFILKTSSVLGTPIVLSLAGIAGIILSIGMAVDANILIFERIKEELRDGKSFSAAFSKGFERAWTSIRDSNVSSLITCAILAWFGSSLIRGFAINLAIGILISMFTAIVVTRILLKMCISEKMATSKWILK